MTHKNHDVIIQAIKHRKRVTFNYQSSTDTEPTPRTVEVWVYGTQNGKDALFGQQVEGGSGEAPRRFNLSKVKNIQLLEESSTNTPEKAANVSKWEEIYQQW